MSGWYASYWNAFLFATLISCKPVFLTVTPWQPFLVVDDIPKSLIQIGGKYLSLMVEPMQPFM